MPVILNRADCDVWLEAEVPEAMALYRPHEVDRLKIVAIDQRQDGTG